jgi:hypothetical protein
VGWLEAGPCSAGASPGRSWTPASEGLEVDVSTGAAICVNPESAGIEGSDQLGLLEYPG